MSLHESLEAHCQPYHLWILALDDQAWDVLCALNLPHVTTVPLYAVETAELKVARGNRIWLEYIWTLTSAWMLYVLGRVESVSFIDADCYFFSSPQYVFDEIGGAPLGITPHCFPEHARNFEINGIYNVGLVYAIREAMPVIKEWSEQCIEWCYYRAENGKYADQKYLDPWPEKYGAHVIRHPGANLAPWNNERYSYKVKDGKLRVDNLPIIWYHFHRALNPAWTIHPILRQTIYADYEKALKRARDKYV
ncbi:MAG: glycosyl transferase [Gammaproteobacteria bacterium]|nr:glycosyl transferase [Gammaproteobacteria bacterium]